MRGEKLDELRVEYLRRKKVHEEALRAVPKLESELFQAKAQLKSATTAAYNAREALYKEFERWILWEGL